jgi:hypothetical protein
MRTNLLPLKPIDGDPNTPRALLPKGSPEWCHRTLSRLKWAFEEKKITEGEFNKVLNELDEYRAWEVIPEDHPYGSKEAMLQAEIGLAEQEARIYVAWLAENAQPLNGHGGDRKSEQVVVLAEQAEPLDQHGRADQGSNPTLIGNRDAQYLADRIARDYPAILERMKAGEFRSVRAAALEAGIVKPRLQPPDDPAGLARYLRRKWTPERVAELVRLLTRD